MGLTEEGSYSGRDLGRKNGQHAMDSLRRRGMMKLETYIEVTYEGEEERNRNE